MLGWVVPWIFVFAIMQQQTKEIMALPEIVYIGGLFETTSDPAIEMAFDYSMKTLDLGGRSRLSRVPSTSPGSVEMLNPDDSFAASKKVCQMTRFGVAAIFGPQSDVSADHVQSMCQTLKIPHIQTRWDPSSRPADDIDKNANITNIEIVISKESVNHQQQKLMSINLYPHPESLSRAYSNVVQAYNWKSFTILYQDEDGLIRLEDLLQMSTMPGYKVVARQLPNSDDYRPLLNEMKKMGEVNIVLDCQQLDKITALLDQAQEVGMTRSAQSYLITSLDMHTLDYEKYRDGGVRISGVRMVDPHRKATSDTVSKMIEFEKKSGKTGLNLADKPLLLEAALVYDSVQLYAKSLLEMNRKEEISTKSLNCDGSDTWLQGPSLINHMKTIEMEGLTGVIKLDSDGLRTDFKLDIVELEMDGLNTVGTWNDVDGAAFSDEEGHSQESLFNKTIIVTTIRSNPYFMLKESDEMLTENDRYEGFVFDIMDEISRMLGFRYVFKLVDDGRYGNRNKETGEWNGMIQELIDGRADLAIGDLTITYDRETAVDFTKPFLNTGISILYKKPQETSTNLFSFLSPLSMEVWIYIGVAYIAVSLVLFAMSRITPYEWTNPHPCRQQPDIVENQFTLLNSMWFSMSSLMQQGSDMMPKATSTRLVAGLWWFFTLIMISSYIANLAAFLTVGRMDSPISSVEDLAKQTKIKYGTLAAGTTHNFFKYSSLPTQQEMWKFMSTTQPSVFVKSTMEGVERVQRSNGQYAFLMESTSIEFFIERKCDLTQIGGAMDSKGYGIAMRPGSPYRAALNEAILKLQETNRLLILKKKWWQEMRGGGACDEDDGSNSSAAELGFENLGGIFILLILGSFIALLIAIIQFVWKSRKLAIEDGGGKGSVGKHVMDGLKVAFNCCKDTKSELPSLN